MARRPRCSQLPVLRRRRVQTAAAPAADMGLPPEPPEPLRRSRTITEHIVWDDPRVRIGSGRYGTVYRSALGGWRGLTVAVKEERAMRMVRGKWDVARMQEEAAMLERLRHPNLVMFLGSDLTQDQRGVPPVLSIVTEYCPGGSLHDALHGTGGASASGDGLQPAERVRAARQIGSAVQMLHSEDTPIVHRDLTSNNVLLTRSRDAKVGDFGLARTLKKANMETTWAGTPEYMAPEHWRGEPLTPAVDVFSFGVLLYELITCRVPWNLAPDYEILMAVHEGKRLELPEGQDCLRHWPAGTRDLVQACWAHDAADRPTMREAVQLLGNSGCP